VTISVPNPITIYGDSLSAMVALTVIALAKHDSIMEDCIITGGIAPDGHISKAGGLSLKLAAASKSHIHHVLVPDEFDPSEPDWQTPFLMHVSPVDSVQQAYQALTGSPIN
jgi:predicted S18 family serine protease